jgi:predicted DNA-binding protein
MSEATANSRRYGMGADEYAGILDSPDLVFTDDPLPDDIPTLGPDEEIMVPVSIRVSTDVYYRLKGLAEKRGVKYTVMLREWVEAELLSAESDSPVSRDEALRAVDVLRRLGMVA